MTEQPAPKPESEEQPQGSRSAPIGLIALLILGGLFVWHDQRTVSAARANHDLVSTASEQVAGYAKAAPAEGDVAGLRDRLEAVVKAAGGADCSPLFGAVAREGTQKAARDNVCLALAQLVRLEILDGDLPGAREALARYERETKEDYAPADAETWTWRVSELAEHPKAGSMTPAQLRAALFSSEPVEEAVAAALKLQ